MSSPFPLLRLPELVLCEVFKSLNIGEKIKLSICSKKISTQINNTRLYSQKVIIVLDMLHQGIRVHTENNKNSFEIFTYPDSEKTGNSDIKQFSIACCSVPALTIPTGIKIFWKNHREGFLTVIHHLLKIFPCKISTKSSCCDSDLFQPTISMLFDLQLEFKMLTISLNGSKDENLFWNQISNKLGLVKSLSISSIPDPGFRPVFTSWPLEINIGSSAWFTLESLLACTCTRIILEESLLKNKWLDLILRKWKAGGYPNLTYLRIQGQNISINGTRILGINLWELDYNVIETEDESKEATIRMIGQSMEIYVIHFHRYYILK
ncbi:hypothetical protein CRE_21992 [Caenorhabditis remanei]|uniref:F-box domain-containing protein n=1 Tax=Caenorhabditis remanei TaxID=31234 RepID=E3N3I1_CAERE|nr:hypothetical protein CRE_21992 [Caenorhabditis remanei]